ncbi:MAG: HAD hydrolase family protein [Solirubrobacteraceae bacterium]|nr:HAD hydrolase family protein [Solirubrobacteraceae bacterium]
MRALYVDLDGTLLGRGGSLVHDADGNPSLLSIRAVEACLRVQAEVVLMSGRRLMTVREPARLLGQPSYIFEAGAGLVLDGETFWLCDGLEPGELTIAEQVAVGGAPELLLERFAGRLEYHAPWHEGREVSHLFRGAVPAAEADAALAEAGHDQLRLVDNGAIDVPQHGLDVAASELHAYHLVPRGVSKARAVARHQRARGYAPEDCIAAGDSREDLAVAAAVGTFWLMANGLTHDPTITQHAPANVRVAEERNGAGVYEAVVTTLAER